uniref:Uncharacterized protein LOC110203895 isoform X2 n=1 Tax=Phascolarctos cinereus TaxID=38626 RepID=A0A6P5JRH6_PHACI|nr:uncharacterized protein LOC110203895 isoform X2 [Phascolarctos cinereus]
MVKGHSFNQHGYGDYIKFSCLITNKNKFSKTASVSAPVPTSSTLFTSSEVGVVPVTHGPDHGAPGGMAVLTSGPLTPDSTVSPMGGETSVVAITHMPGQGATGVTASDSLVASSSGSPTRFSTRSTTAGRTTVI